MTRHKIIWTEDQDRYLRKKYPNNPDAFCLHELRTKHQFNGYLDAMKYHAKNILGLKKTESYKKKSRAEAIKKCLEKRGEDFNERQRQRALKDNWWGCKHNNGNNLTREERKLLALKNFHSEGIQDKAKATRRKNLMHDYRRMAIGLAPIHNSRVRNLGNPQSRKETRLRFSMKKYNKYIVFRGDPDIYYDSNTKRSQIQEKHCKEQEIYVRPIEDRGKPLSSIHHETCSLTNSDYYSNL